MPIAQLAEEAGAIFGLDPEFVILMLFTALPQTLDKRSRVAGPPRVPPDSSVFVFCFGSSPERRSTYGTQPPPVTGRGVDHGTYPQCQQQPRSSYVPDLVSSQRPLLNSKLLGGTLEFLEIGKAGRNLSCDSWGCTNSITILTYCI
jgi:hypothetical protein